MRLHKIVHNALIIGAETSSSALIHCLHQCSDKHFSNVILHPAAGQRKSKRARKNRVPVRVDSTMTLRELKMRLLQELDVHPINSQVYVRGLLLTDNEATLAG